MSLNDTDPEFPEDLAKSNEHAWRVARWFQTIGIPAAVQPVRLRPTPEERAEYGDNGDLVIVQRVEAKQRRFDWTCRSDFPHRDGVIVDVCHAWDRAFPKPHLYVITNQSVTHAILIEGRTSWAWRREPRYDRRIKRKRNFYICPLDLAEFKRMDQPSP